MSCLLQFTPQHSEHDIPAKTSAINDSDGQRWTIDLLLGQLNVQELDRGGKVGILFVVHDDGGLNRVSGTLNVNPGLVDC